MRTTMTKIMMTLLVSIITAATANAATFTVTNTSDSGAGSLRQAIINANNLAGNDEISFSLTGCPCTITLTSGELSIINNGSVTINAPAYKVTVSGNNNSRVFLINSGATATISGITISGGNGVSPTNNSAGGGIDNEGTLFLIGVTVSGNTAINGGGIENGGTLTLINSTVSGNTAGSFGAGIRNAIGSVTLINSTISNNFGDGIAALSNTSTTLNNSIIANNAVDCYRGGTAVINASYSLIEGGVFLCVNGTNSNNNVGDPNLGPLQDNGGTTFTHALLSGSIAIDAGSNSLVPSSITTDQRGVQRIMDGNNDGTAIVDMGSYEATAPTAAGAAVSGQVTTGRRGLNKAIVYLQGIDGSMRIMRTNPFGYFQFEDVEAGKTYIVSVMSKQYQFEPQVISISGALDNLLFTPLGTVNVVKSKDGLIP